MAAVLHLIVNSRAIRAAWFFIDQTSGHVWLCLAVQDSGTRFLLANDFLLRPLILFDPVRGRHRLFPKWLVERLAQISLTGHSIARGGREIPDPGAPAMLKTCSTVIDVNPPSCSGSPELAPRRGTRLRAPGLLFHSLSFFKPRMNFQNSSRNEAGTGLESTRNGVMEILEKWPKTLGNPGVLMAGEPGLEPGFPCSKGR